MARFLCTWRNKYLAVDAETFDQFIDAIEGALNKLKTWRDEGIVFTTNGVVYDYAEFMTSDPELAKKYGFEEEEIFDADFKMEEED